jgi:hypothetical protein
MMTETSDVLGRFHRTLVEEIRRRRPEYLAEPFTVAEIYQNLIPYGTHRDRLGVEMNGDYEDALLRILAGEGGYLILESEPALRVLRQELESPNPNTGLYREYAAVDVRLAPGQLEGGIPVAPAVAAQAAPGTTATAPALPFMLAERPTEAAGPEGQVEACRWCRAELPRRASLKYCPFCGTDIRIVPCPECGEELEPEWRFCISCGTEIGH